MRRSWVALSASVVLATASLSACGTDEPPKPSGPPLTSRIPDACSLLKPLTKKLHLTKMHKHAPDGCLADTKTGDDATTGTLGVDVRDKTLDGFRKSATGKTSDTKMLGHDAVVSDEGDGFCTYGIEITANGRIGVQFAPQADAQSCDGSRALVADIVQQLPPVT